MFEYPIHVGDRVIHDDKLWVVRSVNVDAKGCIYSLNLDRLGVTTCCEPKDVTLEPGH